MPIRGTQVISFRLPVIREFDLGMPLGITLAKPQKCRGVILFRSSRDSNQIYPYESLRSVTGVNCSQ